MMVCNELPDKDPMWITVNWIAMTISPNEIRALRGRKPLPPSNNPMLEYSVVSHPSNAEAVKDHKTWWQVIKGWFSEFWTWVI